MTKANSGRTAFFARICAIALICAPCASAAQEFSFVIDNVNGIDPTEAYVSLLQTGTLNPLLGVAGPGGSSSSGTASLIVQQGSFNAAATFIIESPGAGIASFQSGDSNEAVAAIEDSPGSLITQLQLGDENLSEAAIVGGSNSSITMAQIGNNLTGRIGLRDSNGAAIVYGQIGQDVNGSVTFENVPPGTVITIGETDD